MPAKHPGVIQFEFIGRTIHIPAVASIELADLQQTIIQILLRSRKSKMMANSLCHGCEKNPIIRVCAFAIHLCEPGNHLSLLSCCHFIEDTLAAHPDCYSNICTLNDALI